MNEELEAGPVLDATMAELLGWRYDPDTAADLWWQAPNGQWHYAPPAFSADMGAAWQVVEALAHAPHYTGVTVGTTGIPHAQCFRGGGLVGEAWIALDNIPDTRSLAARCALAICRAALLAVASEVEGQASP